MFTFLLKRLGQSIVIIWGVVTFTFILMHLAPGDPSQLYLRPEIEPKVLQNIRHQLGLDLPLYKQYFQWIKGLIQGDWGFSFLYKRQVLQILQERLGNTLQLTTIVLVLQALIGIPLGMIMALKKGRWLDHSTQSLLIILYSAPGFWVAIMLIYIFSLKLDWLPSSQMQSIIPLAGSGAILLDRLRHFVLPVTVLTIPFVVMTSRFVRDALVQVLKQSHIRSLMVLGIPRWKILWKYALKNASLPLATSLGLYVPFLLGGAVITEYIFSWPGMGRLTVQAIFSHDYPIILATNLIAAFSVVIGNLFSDVLYMFIDPRIRLHGRQP